VTKFIGIAVLDTRELIHIRRSRGSICAASDRFSIEEPQL